MAGTANTSAVSRAEFSEVRDAVVGLEKTVQALADAATAQSASLKELHKTFLQLSTDQAQSSGQRGTIQLANVWHALGAAMGFAVVAGSLVMYAVRADISPLESDVENLEYEFQAHASSEGHPQLASRVAALERTVDGNYLENETQHRWLSDIVNLERDWRNRTRGIELPPAHYAPLNGIGQGTSIGQ